MEPASLVCIARSLSPFLFTLPPVLAPRLIVVELELAWTEESSLEDDCEAEKCRVEETPGDPKPRASFLDRGRSMCLTLKHVQQAGAEESL